MEHVIAWVRLLVVPGVFLGFLLWPERTSGQMTAVLVEHALDVPYALVVFALKPWKSPRVQLWGAITAALDFAFLMFFVLITGGAESPFVPLLIPVLAAAAMRFGSVGVVLSGLALTVPLAVDLVISQLSSAMQFSALIAMGAMWLVGIGLTILRREEDLQHEENLTLALEAARSASKLDVANLKASTDGLTGIANYTRFYSALNDAIAGGKGIAVVYVDLDNFKWVNDNLGHLTGDDVLRAFADELQSIAPAASVAARVGGDEFAVLLVDGTATAVDELAARVREIAVPAGPEAIVASVGTADTSASQSAAGLMEEADRAMYREKQQRTSDRLNQRTAA